MPWTRENVHAGDLHLINHLECQFEQNLSQLFSVSSYIQLNPRRSTTSAPYAESKVNRREQDDWHTTLKLRNDSRPRLKPLNDSRPRLKESLYRKITNIVQQVAFYMSHISYK